MGVAELGLVSEHAHDVGALAVLVEGVAHGYAVDGEAAVAQGVGLVPALQGEGEVQREVFAAVPAHLAAERMVIDRFAAVSKLRSDGVLGFHSALELHGLAYSEFNEV